MGSNHTLRPSEGGTVTRAAPCRAPLRRWEWRAVAHEQGAPRLRTRPPGGTLADLRLRPACRLNPTQERNRSRGRGGEARRGPSGLRRNAKSGLSQDRGVQPRARQESSRCSTSPSARCVSATFGPPSLAGLARLASVTLCFPAAAAGTAAPCRSGSSAVR